MTASHGSINKRTWVYDGQRRTAYAYCFTYQKGGKKLRARGQAPSRDEAIKAMQAAKLELAQAAEVATAAPTLAVYAQTWLAAIKPDIAQRTLKSYADLLRRHILPTLGEATLTAITRGDVMKLLAAKRASGLGKNTVRLIRATMSALFTDALDQELVTAHPALKVGRVGRGSRKAPDSIGAGERREKVRALDRAQLASFLALAGNDRAWPLWLFLADTGCRPSEGAAIEWEDLDLANRTAHIHRALDLDGSTKRTKTGTGRYVDLSARLVAALDRHQTTVEADALARGREVPKLVFPSEAGLPIRATNLSNKFRKLAVRAGLPKQGGPYLLRHTYASHLLGLSKPITYVSHQMGHASPMVTLSVYAHFIPTGDHNIADDLEAWRRAPANGAEVRL
jgi:integrase